MTSICPILVLGSARNGTTWLGNLLSNHREITGVTHASHWGQVEARLLSTSRFAGNLRDERGFIRFAESFAASDFFRAAGGRRGHLYEARYPSTYELQFALLDRLARASGNGYWVTKLEPQFFHEPRELEAFLRQLDGRYARSYFVSIRRPLAPVLESYLDMQTSDSHRRQTRLMSWVAAKLQTLRYVVHNHGAERLITQRRGWAVDFDQLKADTGGQIALICDYLGVAHDANAACLPWQKNASSGAGRLSPSQKQRLIWWATRVWYPAFRHMTPMARCVLKAWDRCKGEVCPWYYRILQLEQMGDRLRCELEQSHQTELWRLLFSENALQPAPAAEDDSRTVDPPRERSA